MTTIASPRALPDQGTPAPETLSTTADVIEFLKRSNHATSFAGWTVITIAMCLVLQAGTLRTVESFSVTLVLMGLLVPVLAATVRTGVLLASAGRAASVAGGESEPTGAAAGVLDADDQVDELEAATRLARDRLWSTLTAARTREKLARRALIWAYGSGAAFLTWSLAVILLASR
ncbi:MAG TPA: hypothetical protein VE465_04960 [Streptosporangiaceae bacterium]|jgi:hypothetical protein|nr:hypothetical protein [Streptosporangiaceae bacterium]